jgi:hypothetical protein
MVLAAAATSMKMTLALPFAGLLALHRRAVAILASIGCWLVLNLLGFVRMGRDSFADYRHNMQFVESFGNVNSPDPWEPRAETRLDWTCLFYGLTRDLTMSRIVAMSLSTLVALWLAFEAYRTPRPVTLDRSAAYLGAAVCLGSLCVYHHDYDACLFFAPLLFGYLIFGNQRIPAWAFLFISPLALILLLLPLGQSWRFLLSHVGPPGVVLLRLSFPITLSLALVGCLGILHWQIRGRPPQRSDFPPA